MASSVECGDAGDSPLELFCSEGFPLNRRNEILRLRTMNLSYIEIGRRFGISDERVRQIIKGNPARPKSVIESKLMLTTSDVAYLLGVHRNTVRRWNKKGILKSYRIGFRSDRRFRREDIDKFLKEAESGN